MTAAERIADLEARVAYLEEELGLRFDPATILIDKLSLTPQEAQLLVLLYRAAGRPLTKSFIGEQLPAIRTDERDNDRTIKVVVSHVRRKVGAGAIETLNSLGYRLTESGRDLVHGALA